jgi:phosphopantetheinyl transferase
MPFEKKISTTDGLIGIWNLNDSLDDLKKQCQLSDSEEQRFDTLIIERRKKEFLATRILLQKLFGSHQLIIYNAVGKPLLQNSSKNISISHSADFVTIFVSEKVIGIDVERTTRSIDKVAKRFLHPKEQEFIEILENKQWAKILLWSAKEAIFKCSKFQGILFNEQIRIKPFALKAEGDFEGSLQLDENKTIFNLHYIFFKNNVMVYCVEQ